MTKNMIKMVVVLLVAVLTIATFSQVVLATSAVDASNVGDIYKNAQDKSDASTAVGNIIGSIITIVQVVGTGVAIIMLIVLAIKYISAAPGDKADIKKHAVVYVVGAVVLFAATGILQIVKGFASGNINDAVSE